MRTPIPAQVAGTAVDLVPVAEHRRSLDVSIVIPTYDEPGVGAVIERVDRVTRAAGLTCEVIVVDDTPGTCTATAAVAAQVSCPVLVIRRPDRPGGVWGGLSGSVLDGFARTRSPRALVMDGDGQHPAEKIPALVRALDDADLAIASRYTGSGDSTGLADGYRRAISATSTLLARGAFPMRVGRRTTDPMTGFFAANLARLDPAVTQRYAIGFKILMAILVTHPDLRVAEIAFVFGEREAGTSKAGWRNGAAFLRQVARMRVTA